MVKRLKKLNIISGWKSKILQLNYILSFSICQQIGLFHLFHSVFDPSSSLDLVISCLGLHWTNDLPGAMIQVLLIIFLCSFSCTLLIIKIISWYLCFIRQGNGASFLVTCVFSNDDYLYKSSPWSFHIYAFSSKKTIYLTWIKNTGFYLIFSILRLKAPCHCPFNC